VEKTKIKLNEYVRIIGHYRIGHVVNIKETKEGRIYKVHLLSDTNGTFDYKEDQLIGLRIIYNAKN